MIRVEQVISQNLPRLESSPKLKKCIHKTLEYLLNEKDFIEFEQKYPYLQGIEFVEQVLEEFSFSAQVKEKQLENVPSEGATVLVANHPIGSLDGLALIRTLHKVRPDIKVVANRLLMSLEPLHSLLLPVDNMSGKSRKGELAAINQHLANKGALLIFPAGEVSRLHPTGVKDGAWHGGFLRMANKASASIVPIHVKAKNSALFYGTSMLYKPLASLLLVKEMFKQKNKSPRIEIGEPIAPEAYRLAGKSDSEVVSLIKRHLYRLGSDKPNLLATQNPIALPECRKELKKEISQLTRLGESQDGMVIYLYQYAGSCAIFRELGRLREIAFRAVGEGSGKRRDNDKFDMTYQHLLLWDEKQLEIAGAYRLAPTHGGDTELYTQTLFNYQPSMQAFMANGIELGRSFVQPKYWGMRSLDYLWYGIGAYLSRFSQYRYLFGAVSLSAAYPEKAKAMIVYYYQHYYGAVNPSVTASLPYTLSQDDYKAMAQLFDGSDKDKDFKQLKSLLANFNCAVPTLFKQYAEVCEYGGMHFHCFNVDPDFNNCIDAFIVVDLHALKASKAKRYLQGH